MITNKSLKIPPAAIAAALLAITICFAAQAQQPLPADERTEETKTGAISGRVVNDNGQPLANARVFVRAVGSSAQGSNTTTDAEGSFHVNGLDSALYTVSASVPAFVPPPRDAEEIQPPYYRVGDSVTLVLIKGAVITGTVTNSSGEAVVNVRVRAYLIRDASGQQPRFGVLRFPERNTDDRGSYRLYGLSPGTYVISAGGSGNFSGFSMTAYDSDMPTYAPSSTRDTAAEITVRAGEEMNSVDIRYRGEAGRVVSGTASGPTGPGPYSSFSVTLTAISNGTAQGSSSSFQAPNSRGFAFYGVTDGDYNLTAQSSIATGEVAASEPRGIKVKGADVTGIELTTKPLGSIVGRVTLESSPAPECKDKRRPLFAETIVTMQRNEKDSSNQPGFLRFLGTQANPDKDGVFALRNLVPGQYNFGARFFAKYWYLRSISLPPSNSVGNAKALSPEQRVDGARNWTTLKLGERLTGLNITLAEGAGSLSGQVIAAENEKLPPRLVLYVVPAEREQAGNVLRFFAAPVAVDGTFVLNNLAPGRYWALALPANDSDALVPAKFRHPDESEARAKLRREAEAAKKEIQLKACQNMADYHLPLALLSSVPPK